MRIAGLILAVAGVGSLGYGAYGIATSRPGESLSGPRAVRTLDGLQLTAPARLRMESGALVDDVSLWLEAAACPAPGAGGTGERGRAGVLCGPGGTLQEQLARAVAAVRASWPDAGLHAGQPPALPAPWQGQILHVAHEGLGGVERYRVLVAGRTHDGAVWLVVAQVPEALAGAVTPAVIEMLRSAAPAAPPPPASGTGAGG